MPFDRAEGILKDVLRKAHFWERHRGDVFNPRQKDILNRRLDGFEEKLTSSKWAKLSEVLSRYGVALHQ